MDDRSDWWWPVSIIRRLSERKPYRSDWVALMVWLYTIFIVGMLTGRAIGRYAL